MTTRGAAKSKRREFVQQPVGQISRRALPENYAKVLQVLKDRVRAAHARAATIANAELIALYLYIGKTVSKQATSAGWGDQVVERLAKDLRAEFPDMKGFSRTNVFYMRQVYEAWAASDVSVQQLVGLIPWGASSCAPL